MLDSNRTVTSVKGYTEGLKPKIGENTNTFIFHEPTSEADTSLEKKKIGRTYNKPLPSSRLPGTRAQGSTNFFSEILRNTQNWKAIQYSITKKCADV